MKVIVDFCLVPVGVGVSVSKYIVECEKILADAGLKTQLHAYGTNIEGEWDEVFAAIKHCHEHVHEMGVPRISTTIKLGTRTDREQSMNDKMRSVQEKLLGS
ncbi:MAG: hypothetical protein A2032_07135 [Chloroflexi bacterium RBG_19FT_COMBO_49_13]|nr:MAG: hypothetical protein A2Y53_00595 [Chloroflexi bacterium RBG_16_47_49]OGO62320.1 MAG: hypothetical protein A2032_07135 [Chloroflexi bacterium RBG_19FT_COMBO_49_13]